MIGIPRFGFYGWLMKTSIKLVLALAGIAAMALSSCNTVAGFGRDIQGAGEAINKSANR